MYSVIVKFLKGHSVTYLSSIPPQYGVAPYLMVGDTIIPLISVESFKVMWDDPQPQ